MSSNNINLELNPHTKTFGYQDLDVTVATNYEAGYVLSMSTSSSSTDLVRDNSGDGVSATIETLPTLSGGYDDNTFVVNKWGYKVTSSDTNPEKITANYYPFTLSSNLATNTAATNHDSTTLRFASKINYNQPAGSYHTDLVFTATANPIIYDISYYNGYDNTTAIATQTSDSNTSTSIIINPTYSPTIPGTTPTRDTYTFAGWCLSNTNHSQVSVNTSTEVEYTDNTNTKIKAYHNPATICNGTTYNTGDYMILDKEADNTNINFYAIWTPTTVAEGYNKKSKSLTMQNMDADICSYITPNQWGIVTDNRDNQEYHIAKLEDNRCWMLDNLNLDLTSSTVANALTTSNTNASQNALNALRNGVGANNDGLAVTGLSYSNWGSTNSYTQGMANRSGRCDPNNNVSVIQQCLSPYQGTTSSTTDGSYTYNKVTDKYGIPAADGSGTANTTYNIGGGNYKIGTYYNYCAATAGSYCYEYKDETDKTAPDAQYDICPSGWRLPRSGTSVYPASKYNEFQALINTIQAKYPSTYATGNSPFSTQTALSISVAGFYLTSSARWQGVRGIFWSSIHYSVPRAHVLTMSGIGINSQSYYYRDNGNSVRCIAQN